MAIDIISLVILLFVLVTAIAAVYSPNLLAGVFILSAFSFFLSIFYTILGAADVAFTEAMVGCGATTIFFILALVRSSSSVAVHKSTSHHKTLGLVIIFALGGLFSWGSLDLPLFGSIASASHQYLSPYYLLHGYHDSHTPNIVTAVVGDYRSFDTMIESAVIFSAGIACLLIMRAKND